MLGVGQSVNAMARILGSAIGIPLLKFQAISPYWISAFLMSIGAIFIFVAVRSGTDFVEDSPTTQKQESEVS